MSLKRFILDPIYDLATGIDVHIARAERRGVAIAKLLVAAVATWWVYVPIHELLHVAGCLLTGGTVSELQVAPIYGGAWLARVFPFVVSGGDYAGRLSGFEDETLQRHRPRVLCRRDVGGVCVPCFHAGGGAVAYAGKRPATYAGVVVLSDGPVHAVGA